MKSVFYFLIKGINISLGFPLFYSWSAKLYLTPSNIVLLTAIALIGVCVFILAIIGILHWQEKVSLISSIFLYFLCYLTFPNIL